MPIRCISVDDELHGRQGLEIALTPFEDFELVQQFDSAESLLNAGVNDIDVLFLDIEMPRSSGFELLAQWQGTLPIVIFVTAYDQYAVQAFEQQALDYLLKPIEQNRFAKVIGRIRQQLQQKISTTQVISQLKTIELLKTQLSRQAKSISVKTDTGYVRVKVSEITHIESVGDHVCINLLDQQLITRQTLKYYIVDLSEYGFHQVHRSYLVNAQHVKKINKLRFRDHQLVLSNEQSVRLSRRYSSVLEHLTC